MNVNSVKLTNFRNYKSSLIEFDEELNIIYGKNASGKTNLLESIFYFASLKSFRGCKEKEMINFEENFSVSELDFDGRNGNNGMKIVLHRNGKKELFCNNLKITKLAQFLGVFRAVIFTPDHLSLIKGMPENRRKFIDLAICQSFPRYVASLNDYNKILSQKNSLLKSDFSDTYKYDLVDIYNEKMSQLGAVITLNRNRYINRLKEEASYIHSEMGSGEKMEISYLPNAGEIPDGASVEDLSVIYRELFDQKKEKEIKSYTVMCGIHRDDFKVIINGKNAKFYASQGQQRTAVISMKLAEGALSKSLTGEYPVFLFDDVLSELDEKRKKNIMEKIKDKQVILTGCDEELSKSVSGKKIDITKIL